MIHDGRARFPFPARVVIVAGVVCRRLASSLLLAAALAPAEAHALERARLEVTRAANARDCPDTRAVADAVAARLGLDPFGPEEPDVVRVAFARDGANLRGSVQLVRGGEILGERALASTQRDCDELASATTLTISILLDPHTGDAPAPKPEPEPTPTPPPARDTTPPPAPVGAGEPVHLLLSFAALGAVGLLPAPDVGARLGVGVQVGRWSVRGELRADAPAGAEAAGRTARASFVGGALVPCGHLRVAYACAVATLGALRGEVPGATPEQSATFHALVGPRIGASVPLAEWLFLDAHVEGALALTTTTLRTSTTDLWTTPDLSGALGLGLTSVFR